MFSYLTVHVLVPTDIYQNKHPFAHTCSYWCPYPFSHSFIGHVILLPSIPLPNYPQLMTHKQHFTHSVYCRYVYDLLCTVCHVTNSSASLTPTNRRATKTFRSLLACISHFTINLPHLKLYLSDHFIITKHSEPFACVCVCVCVCGARAYPMMFPRHEFQRLPCYY